MGGPLSPARKPVGQPPLSEKDGRSLRFKADGQQLRSELGENEPPGVSEIEGTPRAWNLS